MKPHAEHIIALALSLALLVVAFRIPRRKKNAD